MNHLTLGQLTALFGISLAQVSHRLKIHRGELESGSNYDTEKQMRRRLKQAPHALTQQAVLQEQANLSLDARVLHLHQQGIEVSKYALRKLFKEAGVRYKFLRFKHRWRRPDDQRN